MTDQEELIENLSINTNLGEYSPNAEDLQETKFVSPPKIHFSKFRNFKPTKKLQKYLEIEVLKNPQNSI